MESGGQDVDGIVQKIDNSISFGVLGGVDTKLVPLWLAIYGHPLKGLLAFSSKLRRMRLENGSRGAQNDFFSKCEVLREKDPDSYEKFQQEQVLFANLTAGSGTSQSLWLLSSHRLCAGAVASTLHALAPRVLPLPHAAPLVTRSFRC